MLRRASGSLWSSPTLKALLLQQQARPTLLLSGWVLKTPKGGVFTSPPDMGPRAAPSTSWKKNVSWWPIWASWVQSGNLFFYLLLLFLSWLFTTANKNLIPLFIALLQVVWFLETIDPWKYWQHWQLEETALKLSPLFWAEVRVGVSRNPFQPELFHNFAVRLDSISKFLLKGSPRWRVSRYHPLYLGTPDMVWKFPRCIFEYPWILKIIIMDNGAKWAKQHRKCYSSISSKHSIDMPVLRKRL